jgi:serine/threonine protein kinase
MQFFGSTSHFPHAGEGAGALLIELLLELMPNGTLFDNLHMKHRFELWPEKIGVLCGIAKGVEYLHAKNIVHRDLSSLNILFSADMVPKIADFGCARKVVGGYYDPQKVLGSPAYMSPEQLVGSKLTTKSDVWGLGVLIWEVIAERGPWGDRDSNNRVALKQHIVDNNGKLPKINSTRFEVMYAKHYEERVEQLLAGCFRVTPAKRSSASDVVKALAAINGPVQRTHVKIDNTVSAASARTASSQAAASRPGNPGANPPVQPMVSQQNGVHAAAPQPATGSEEYVRRLEAKIRAFSQVYNPNKLGDVHLVAKFHIGKEDVLNQRLRAQYRTDLVEFCKLHPELEDPPLQPGCSCLIM